MAAKGTTLVTLSDVAKGKNKMIGKVAEVLTKQDAVVNDIPYMQANEGTYHVESLRSSLPEVYYRKANQAIPASKTTVEDRTFNMAHFESKSQMDQKVANRGGTDRIGYNRWNQAVGHIQAMGQEHAKLIWYGSPADDHRKVAGIMDVYSTVNLAVSETAKQVVDGGGTGSDNASMVLICWGENSIFGIYPAGTTAGLKRTDRSAGGKLVQITALDEKGNMGTFWGYEEDFEMDHGIVVKDFRQGARLANIDISNLRTNTTPIDLVDKLIDLVYCIDNLENGTPVIYGNRTLELYLHKQALDAVSNGKGLTFENFEGKRILQFLGIPIRRSDSMLNTEARVV